MVPPAVLRIERGGIQQDPLVAASLDNAGLKKRMRISAEAFVKMVSPVFLAACVSLAKLDMVDWPRLRDSLSVVAGFTLGSAIAGLLPLSISNWFPHKHGVFVFSMACIHLCGISLMLLAFLILCLISKGYLLWSLSGPLAIAATAIIIRFSVTAWNGHERGGTEVHVKFLDKLDNSVDLSAAIIFLLFLGFGGLLLGGQYSTIHLRIDSLPADRDKAMALYYAIHLSFSVCVAGVFFMLVCMVLMGSNCRVEIIGCIVEVFNCIFGGALASIVLLVTLGKMKNWFVPSAVCVLSVLHPFCGAFFFPFDHDPIGRGDEEVKPASLDLTKVTFTGFLAISVYTISENTPVGFRESSCWFIFFTAIAVNNGLWWRLITHHKEPSAAWFKAGNFASLATHTYTILAVITFASMSFDALRKITTTAPSPAPS